MTHSHDRTLLANLAFGDPDKKNAEHSLACRYLAQDAQRDALVELAVIEIKEASNTSYFGGNSTRKKITPEARLEYAINKGEGQYRTTIGFVDVAIILGSCTLMEMRFGRANYAETPIGIGVEVKIGAVPVDELLRQINLYRQYLSFEWVAALRFDVDQDYVDTLEQQNIRVVRLGKKFTEWLKSSQIERVPGRAKEI